MSHVARIILAFALVFVAVPGQGQEEPLTLPEAPEVLEEVAPEYPKIALEARIQGTVVLRVTTNREGTVAEVVVEKGLPFGMTEAAVSAVEKWRFRSPEVDGEPVAARFSLDVVFELPGS